jgi:integration host factor subunit beta
MNRLPPLQHPLTDLFRRAAQSLLLLMERTLARLTKAELTDDVHQVIGLPLKEADIVVCTMLDSIVRALRAGNKVEIRGFGTFNTRQRGGRTGRNPKTGAPVEVP